MKLVANGLNKQFFKSLLPPSGTELDGVVAAIAYGDDRTELLQHCIDNKYRLDIWMRYDHTVPVAPSFLTKLLRNTKNNIFCKLVPDALHSKIIWWKGYGAYIGSANLTDRAWYSNIEAGVFFTESDLIASDMLEQLTEFFDNLESLDKCFELNENIVKEQEKLLELKKQKENEDEKIKSKRKIPFWEGPDFIYKKKSKDRLKDNFQKEWESSLSIIKNISDQIDEYRPIWITEDTPFFWQTDQFLHAYYYNKVKQKDNTYPYEELYQTNSKNPQTALTNMLSWWKSLPVPPSNENDNLQVKAPLIRQSLQRSNIQSLKENDLLNIIHSTHATMDHLIKMSSESLGEPNKKTLTRNERLPLYTKLLMSLHNQKGQNIFELLEFVLYGGKAENMWERIYLAGKDENYKFANYGINSIAEVAGWARPEDTPPRNGRTNKALRALGYPVKISI
ncbi:phospholipase D family protein [Providencia sp. PROV132]|uniref:phospholipase D family protein n=1 Tax=Providencia sp. PROV132 TaxID=2949842 RepID=UPI002349B006|nr:phospholipase D family protein [Providencia sp. PROV132]